MKVHFGSGNDSAEDYYYIRIDSATTSALGLAGASMTEAGYVAAHSLTLDSQGVFNAVNFAQYVLVPQSVRDQFAADAVATRYGEASGDYSYYFIDDTRGDRHVISFYQDAYLGDNNLDAPRAAAISTQDAAQAALDTIKTAIVSKDKIRANLGAMQNRLENTVTNLQTQAENLQASESRISDVDVSLEMTNFVRSQIKSQAAVSHAGSGQLAAAHGHAAARRVAQRVGPRASGVGAKVQILFIPTMRNSRNYGRLPWPFFLTSRQVASVARYGRQWALTVGIKGYFVARVCSPL